MKILTSVFLRFLSVLLLLTLSFSLKASHYSSGEIFYRWSPTPTDSLRYEICVYFYRYTGSPATIPNQPINICISSSCYPDVSVALNKNLPPPGQASPNDNNGGWIVNGLDECADVNDPDYKDLAAHIWCGYATLPGICGDFEFTAGPPCCRDEADNLVASNGRSMVITAKLNNTLGHNSSAEIQAPAGKAFCLSQPGSKPFEFLQAAFDADGDSLVYRLGHPEEATGFPDAFNNAYCGGKANIPFATGYTVNNPFPSSTGFVIDQKTGIFRFSPSQQGSYVIKIVVEDWRFDPVHLLWVKIGEMVREIQIPVTANCNPTSQAGPRLSLTSSSNNAVIQNFSQAQIDSMKLAYNMQVFFGDDSISNGTATVHQIPIFQGYQCFDSIVSIEFNNNVRCSSVDPTDFRLIGPDGVARPVVEVETNCQFLVTRNLDLKLNQPLDVDGTYVLQIRRGNDGNTLTNECGIELSEFYTFLIPVSGCPSPRYELDGLTVEGDMNIRLDWSGNADLQDPAVVASFDAWNIYRADAGVRPFSLLEVIKDPNARFRLDTFAPNGYYVDNFVYDYQIQLVYNGKGRIPSRFCSNINLRIDNDLRTESKLPVYWNHYKCIDPVVRNYDVFKGKRDTNLAAPGIIWNLHSQTTDTTAIIDIPAADSSNQGTYAIRVVARNVNGSSRTDSSESNWVYYYIVHYPGEPEPTVGEVLIPNIITPNGDGLNDRFYIQSPANGVQYEHISLSIFNRHGERVYQNPNFDAVNDAAQGWEGVNQSGQRLSSGVYFYIIEMSNPSSGEAQSLEGTLTVNANGF
ncbi:gliding motility-associated C-terminal domain-containing protein [Croceimicrobium sp.]|uniref:gliding motility-associated C-terminal domain-containing protein n=1 Tax=Croceimicrobium sp. TaxID=2828340 RepID=UPI003BAD3BBE